MHTLSVRTSYFICSTPICLTAYLSLFVLNVLNINSKSGILCGLHYPVYTCTYVFCNSAPINIRKGSSLLYNQVSFQLPQKVGVAAVYRLCNNSDIIMIKMTYFTETHTIRLS